jgi:hypothetical protein
MWGVVNEGLRQRRNAGDTLTELSTVMTLDGAERVLSVLAKEPRGEPSGSIIRPRVFKTLCDDVGDHVIPQGL